MAIRWTLPGLCLALAAMLGGCTGLAVRDSVQLGSPRIALVQGADTQGAGAEPAVQVGQAATVPLRGYLSARMEAAWVVGDHRLVLITGSTKECTRLETLLIVREEEAQVRPLGKCMDRFLVSQAGDQWTARLLTGRPFGPRDPANWTFRNGTLSGLPQPAPARRGRAAQPDRPSDADRATEPTDNPTDNPTRAPSISRPVGDDVVPPPVGGGPLPGGTPPPPRVF